MPRVVDLPPLVPRLPDGAVVGGWWHDDPTEAGRIVCDLCPRECHLRPGDRAFCFVRENRDGQMVLSTYGHSTGFCIDPVEKKPLNHFYPGTSILSFGTAGCNLGCKFCQNWSISKSREVEALSESASPEAIAQAALQLGCKSVAFTYNDPVVWAEYAIDTAKACRAVGVKSVAVTAGYITPHARGPFYEVMDAANVDLKAFTEEFYAKTTLSHLQPVLDTLEWLKRETDVWFEITNLVIPQANDSPDEFKRMCDWIYDHLGPEVPLHFTAFHPDFRMRDRGRTPADTLFAAYDIATARGLHYVYVGNLADRERQTTHCPSCRERLIERSSYEILSYSIKSVPSPRYSGERVRVRGGVEPGVPPHPGPLPGVPGRGSECPACGTAIAGRFDDRAGDWGSRRQPVRIAEFEQSSQPLVQLGTGYQIKHAPAIPGHVELTPRRSPEDNQSMSTAAPQLSNQQKSAIFDASAEILAATVEKRPAQLTDPTLAGAANISVMGCFVTAKRGNMLRSCCGFMGVPTSIAQALQRAAHRTANDDPRFPPISSSELPFLHLDAWLLFDPQPMTLRGEARREAVRIGEHGLQIARGEQRGLLLPGVATEHNLSPEEFLQHVCIKAGLPPHAWKDDDVQLSTFAGLEISGMGFQPAAPAKDPQQAGSLPRFSPADLTTLSELCRRNILAHLERGTPSPYAFNAADGEAGAHVVQVRRGDPLEELVTASRFAIREGLPVQSTLYALAEQLSRQWEQAPLLVLKVDLAILDDVAMHGTVLNFDPRGYDSRTRGLMLIGRNKSSFVWDPHLSAEQALSEAIRAAGLREGEDALVCSAQVRSTAPRLIAGHQPRGQAGTGIRAPAVAGSFYPGDAATLGKLVDQLLAGPAVEKRRYPAIMVPHAGLKYSGQIAAEVFRRTEIPGTVIVIGPKHTPHGVDWAIAPQEKWSIPGAELVNDLELARALVAAIPGLELDAAAHAREHAIEVELPFLARLAPQTKVVGIALGSGDFAACRRFAQGLAKVLRNHTEPPLLVISTDMNHFASDAENRRLDELALARIDRRDAESLLATCRKQHISMCGVVPAVIVMETLRELGQLTRATRVGYATSADVTGDTSRVVGYAGVVFE